MTVLLIEVGLAQASAEPRFETLEHRGDRRVGLSVLQRLFAVAQTDGERHALVACFYLIPLIEVKNLDGFDEVGALSRMVAISSAVAVSARTTMAKSRSIGGNLGSAVNERFSTMPMAY